MSKNPEKPGEKLGEKLLRVGELASAAGKSVRAIHLYEELGLLTPATRSSGGFRLFGQEAVERINWIMKLQVIGFSLAEIRDFVEQFENARSGRAGTDKVRQIFVSKLEEIRTTLGELQIVENDLVEALGYLESCNTCEPALQVSECAICEHQGHEPDAIPELFAGLSRKAAEDLPYDVDVGHLAQKDQVKH